MTHLLTQATVRQSSNSKLNKLLIVFCKHIYIVISERKTENSSNSNFMTISQVTLSCTLDNHKVGQNGQDKEVMAKLWATENHNCFYLES